MNQPDQDFKGVIIEESLTDSNVLKDMQITNTKVEPVTARHKTPWVKQWTLHNVSILNNKAEDIAKKLSKSLDDKHSWYADFHNDSTHYIIFYGKVFCIDRTKPKQYQAATDYGLTQNIPSYQLSFGL
ncbi:MAG: hypothetical protein PVI21_06535 [Candidatus Woesebacteria bacterium]|jgi:hypothetical protein